MKKKRENSGYDFKIIDVKLPKHDCDVRLKFPGGGVVTIQARPSNADYQYNGSLDFILPSDRPVTCWEGDSMKAAQPCGGGRGHRSQRHCLRAKQLVTELP